MGLCQQHCTALLLLGLHVAWMCGRPAYTLRVTRESLAAASRTAIVAAPRRLAACEAPPALQPTDASTDRARRAVLARQRRRRAPPPRPTRRAELSPGAWRQVQSCSQNVHQKQQHLSRTRAQPVTVTVLGMARCRKNLWLRQYQ